MRYIKILLLIAASLTLFACGNNSSGSSTTTVIVGTNTINLQGGKAFVNVANRGGNGGGISIDSFSDVKINSNGKVTTTFAVPTAAPVLGDHPGTAFTGTKKVKLSGTDPIVAGDLFVNPDELGLYEQTASGPIQVTGLTVPAGATLILPANFAGDNRAAIKLDYSMEIDGTLTVVGTGTSLYIETGDSDGIPALLKVSSSGKVLTEGTGSIYLFSWGMLINQGAIDSSGSAGQTAGFVELESFGFLYNTGTVTARGGSNGGGTGGNGNSIGMMTFNGSLFTNGGLDNSGGDGSTGGGDGGQMILSSGGGVPLSGLDIDASVGRTLVGGTLTSNGGNATNSGNGGSGANFYAINPAIPIPSNGIVLESNQSGQLLVSARINSKGGAASGAANNTGGNGGDLVLFQGFGQIIDNDVATEGIKFGATVNLSGGTAGLDETSSSANLIGGHGGIIRISNGFAPNAYPPILKNTKTSGLPIVELVGYVSINLSGGDAGYGGDGGTCLVFTHSPKISDLVYPAPGINSSVPITAKGGDGNLAHDAALNYRGGRGGTVVWAVGGIPGNPDNAFQDKISLLDNKGAINVSGGDGDFGGDGMGLAFYGYALKNTGAISARGGKGTTQGGNGAAVLELLATNTMSNTAAIATTGGSGVTGGNGGNNVYLVAKVLTNSGAISANGGSGSTLAGSGGLIDLESHNKSTKNSGSLNVAKGGPSGQNGRIIIDLVERNVPESGIIAGTQQ